MGKAFDRLAVELLGGDTLGEHRRARGIEPERPLGAVGVGDRGEPGERLDRAVGLVGAHGGLDELGA